MSDLFPEHGAHLFVKNLKCPSSTLFQVGQINLVHLWQVCTIFISGGRGKRFTLRETRFVNSEYYFCLIFTCATTACKPINLRDIVFRKRA